MSQVIVIFHLYKFNYSVKPIGYPGKDMCTTCLIKKQIEKQAAEKEKNDDQTRIVCDSCGFFLIHCTCEDDKKSILENRCWANSFRCEDCPIDYPEKTCEIYNIFLEEKNK